MPSCINSAAVRSLAGRTLLIWKQTLMPRTMQSAHVWESDTLDLE